MLSSGFNGAKGNRLVSNCVNTKEQIFLFNSEDWNNDYLNFRLFKTMDYFNEPQFCYIVKYVESIGCGGLTKYCLQKQ